MMQIVLTPAAGKRLIATAMARHEAVTAALDRGTLVIVAGTTNGYVAEEVLKSIGQEAQFSRQRFFRGITTPPGHKRSRSGRLSDESRFPGDVVIQKGQWQTGLTIYDVVDELREGDVILKGANAIDLRGRQAAVLIGDPTGGTVLKALQALIGRRVRLILPVGLEKRIEGTIHDATMLLNEPGAKGVRMMPIPGRIFTEIDALEQLAGVRTDLIAAGGVSGAEGAVWLAIRGEDEAIERARSILLSVQDEAPFML